MKATITFELQDVPGPLRSALIEALEQGTHDRKRGAEIDQDAAWWLAEGRADKLLDYLTEGARAALEAMAKRAPEAPIAEVQEEVSIKHPKATDANVYGGILSSFGHAKNRMKAPRRVFEVDERRRLYLMHPDVAGAMLNALRRRRNG
ncbi:MAG TPA: hypothetical protein VEV82_06495 [Actinomycetota bacterium]|nr:hypothetical protein [Actinomycetota bacterium]